MTNVYTELLQENSELGTKVFHLEQENKELKEKVKELDKMTGIFSARLCNKYRSALEEILNVMRKPEPIDINPLSQETWTSRCLDMALAKLGKIQDKVLEVLNE